MSVAHFAHRLEITRNRQQCAGRRAPHGLGDEPDDALFAAGADRRLELGREALAVRFVALAVVAVPVRVAGRDVLHVDQQRRELRASPCIAADSADKGYGWYEWI